MHAFNFFISVLTLATAASAGTVGSNAEATPEAKAIKDNVNHVEKLPTCKEDIQVTVTFPVKAEGLPYLFPKASDFDTLTYQSSTGENALAALVAKPFPGHFALSKQMIQTLAIAGKPNGTVDFFVIPPEVGVLADGEEAPAKHFLLDVTYKCGTKDQDGFPKSYNFTVTNNARAFSLVSSAAALVASALYLL